MNASLQKLWTQDEFFSCHGKQHCRCELDGVQPVATAGGSLHDGDVQLNFTLSEDGVDLA